MSSLPKPIASINGNSRAPANSTSRRRRDPKVSLPLPLQPQQPLTNASPPPDRGDGTLAPTPPPQPLATTGSQQRTGSMPEPHREELLRLLAGTVRYQEIAAAVSREGVYLRAALSRSHSDLWVLHKTIEHFWTSSNAAPSRDDLLAEMTAKVLRGDDDADDAFEYAQNTPEELVDRVYAAEPPSIENSWRLLRIVCLQGLQRSTVPELSVAAVITEPGDVYARLYHAARRIESLGAFEENCSFRHKRRANPTLRPISIGGLVRVGDILNIISSAKAGKSWLIAQLIVCKVAGLHWLGHFPMTSGRVLLIDNELDESDIVWRIELVARALRVPIERVEQNLDLWSYRDEPSTLKDLVPRLSSITPGYYDLVCVDSLYNFLDDDVEENSNDCMRRFFRRVRQSICKPLRTTVPLVHHTSKGQQGDKRTVDVGSGAGVIGRFVDAHLVIREHADDDELAVLDAAVRTFPRPEPFTLRWGFPFWSPAVGVPARVRGARENREMEDRAAEARILAWIRANGPETVAGIRAHCRVGDDRARRVLQQMVTSSRVLRDCEVRRGNRTCPAYQLADPPELEID